VRISLTHPPGTPYPYLLIPLNGNVQRMEETQLKHQLAGNLREIRERIQKRLPKNGPEPMLVVVTKTVGPGIIKMLYELGVRDFGENRVPTAAGKIKELAFEDARWHMIGHLQRNKAGKAEGLFNSVHSVDNLELAEVLSRRVCARGGMLDALIQVNTTDEQQKYGLAPEKAEDVTARVAALPGLRMRGLMTMARLSGEPEESRSAFRLLRQLRDDIRSKGIAGDAFTELSMGMSRDYEIAVEEGATILRVGTAVYEGIS